MDIGKEIDEDINNDKVILSNNVDKALCQELSILFYRYKIDRLRCNYTFMIPDINDDQHPWFITIKHK